LVLADELGKQGWDARVLASDIDTDVLAAAEAGAYDVDEIASVAEPLRSRYFEIHVCVAPRSGG
jgi:chemotaxis methyl-accepting protein methylase